MSLQFFVTVCNFSFQNLQVWASRSSDCTNPMDRGIAGVPVCWLVSQGSTALNAPMQAGENYTIRVQDIVGPENLSPSPGNTMQSFGSEACSVQTTFLAVPINLNFLPIDPGTGNVAGPGYQYTLGTDLVGPNAPNGVNIKDGDTLFVVNWTPNVDSDTGGYDVLIDPIPGQEPADAAVSMANAATDGSLPATMVMVCPADAEAPVATPTDGAASDGEVTDAMTGSAVGTSDAAVFDSGCYPQQQSGSGSTSTSTSNGGTCNNALLTGGTPVNSSGSLDGSTPAPVEEFDDAGNVIDSGTVNATGGGIFIPPTGHVLNRDPTLGTTATGATNSTFTVTGLKNFVNYTVVVAAVDNYGNVGLPSTQKCDFPAPVNDFWKIYRTDGGNAGGGFCALEAVGAPAGSTVAFAGAGALVLAGLRRRRSKRR